LITAKTTSLQVIVFEVVKKMFAYTDKLDEYLKNSSESDQYTTTKACNKRPISFNYKNQECSLPGRSQDVYYAIISNYKNNRERILEFNNKIINNKNNNKNNHFDNQIIKKSSIHLRQSKSMMNKSEDRTIALFLRENESRFGFSLKGAYDAYSHASIEHIVPGK
jgi:hypothetical protein